MENHKEYFIYCLFKATTVEFLFAVAKLDAVTSKY